MIRPQRVLLATYCVLALVLPVATSAGDLPAQPRSPVSVGLLPVKGAGNDEQVVKLRGVVESMLDIEAAHLRNVDLVDRGRIGKVLNELTINRIGRTDLQAGQIVGAEILLATTLSRKENTLVLEMSALETATGNVLLAKKSLVSEGADIRAMIKAFIRDLPDKLIRKAYAVNVVILSITHSSPFPAKGGLAEELRQRLSKKLESIPGARVINRDLGHFLLLESQLAAGGLVDPKRKFAPVAGAIIVQGNLDQQIAPGQKLDESVLTLTMQIRSGKLRRSVQARGTLTNAAKMELSVARGLRTIIAELAGTADKVELKLNDFDRRYWEAQKYLALARPLINMGKWKDPRNRTAIELVNKAAALAPQSAQPYELVKELDLLLVMSSGLTGDYGENPLGALRCRFIDGFPGHPLWLHAVMVEQYALLGINLAGPLKPDHVNVMVSKCGRKNYRRALALAKKVADTVIAGRSTPDPIHAIFVATRLLLLDGQYSKALRLCSIRKDLPLNAYVNFTIDIGRLDWAYKAAEIRHGLCPNQPLKWLEVNGRRAKLRASSEYDRWRPFLKDVDERARKRALVRAARQLPSWGKTDLVERQPLRGLTSHRVSRGVVMSISSQGDRLLAIVRNGDRYMLWSVGTAEPVALSSLPPLVPPNQIYGYVMRPSIASFDGKVYIGAEHLGLFAADPISGKTARVVEGFPDGSVHALVVAGKSLYAIGGGKNAGFIARKDVGKARWRIWIGPKSCGPVRRVAERSKGPWRIYHADRQRLSLFDPKSGKWDEGFSVEKYSFGANCMAATSDLVLFFQTNWDTQHPMYLLDKSGKSILSIFFPPANLSTYSSILDRHKTFWTWRGKRGGTIAPLANHPTDVAAGDGLFWILDANGGLTVTRDGRSFAGPFTVGRSAQSMCMTRKAIYVVSGDSVIIVPRNALVTKLRQKGAFRTSKDVLATVTSGLRNWIQGQSSARQVAYFNLIGLPGLAAKVAFGNISEKEANNTIGQSDLGAGATPCVAVLEAEVVGEISSDEQKALAGQLDTLLTESLTRQKGFVTVDRQALDKVLAERKAMAGGLTKIDPKDVAASLKPFFAGGVLICPTIHKGKQGKMIVSVEAVLAQTGQLLAELHGQGDWENGRWAKSPKFVENMGRFWGDIRRNLKRNTSLPLIEISGKLTSKITRLQWMMDDLGDAASARVALAPNAIPLVPRHPLNTREERLLRVMGLSAAKAGDTAAGLRPTSDVRLVMELGETVKTGISFAKTPISLKLSLQRAKLPAITTEIKSEAGKWEACRKKALAWIDTHVRAMSNGSPTTTKADDEARAKKMALEELTAVEYWIGECAHNHRDMDTLTRLLIVRKALRAAHLDPTNEKAAYLVVFHVEAIYAANGQKKTFACYDRVIAESRRYLNRFGQKVVPHHREVLYELIKAYKRALWHIRGGGRPRNAILHKPDARVYQYIRMRVRTTAERGYLAETDKRYANNNSFVVFGFCLVLELIPNCPEELLDEEYDYWRNWWKTKVEKVVRDKGNTGFVLGPPVPWCLVEAAFQARKKNPKAVRAAFQQMAEEYPKSYTQLWGGDRYKTYQVPVYLRAAGDPEWKTWQPIFKKADPLKISFNEMNSFMYRLKPRTPGPWVLSNLPVIPTTEIVVPERVRKTGRKKGCSRSDVDGLFTAGDSIWLVTPATWFSSERERNWLFAATLTSAKSGKALLDPVEIHWPKYDLPGKPIMTCSRATNFGGKTTVWLGTKSHGLARFKKVGGKWTGRWYTMRDGMPMNSISRIVTCRSGGKKILLLIDRSTNRMFKTKTGNISGTKTMVWTLNPNTGDVKLLFDGSRGNAHCHNPAGRLSNGKKVFLELLGDEVYENVDIKDVTVSSGGYVFYLGGGTIPVTRDSGESGATRVWNPHWRGDSNVINELSPDTLKPVRSSLGRGNLQLSVFPSRVSSIGGVFGTIGWRSSGATMPYRWPSSYVISAVGRADVLWMAFTSGMIRERGRYIVGYRPAPKGSKRWSRKDCWIGPFQTPANSNITHLVPDGENGLLLSTSTGVYRVDCAEAIAQAEQSGRVCSTVEWRKQYEKRLAKTGWQSLVPKLILDKRWDDALKLLDGRQKQLGTITKASSRKSRDEWIRLLLWRAHVNTKKPGGIANAIECYDQVAVSSFAGHPAEVFARMNQILLLHKAGRWQEMLDLCEKVTAKFPQTKPQRKSSRLNWYINNAKQNLKKASKEKMSKVKP